MKVTILLIITIAIVRVSGDPFSPAEEKDREEDERDCVKESDVNPDLVTKAEQGDYVEDDNLKKFFACFLTDRGIMQNGKFKEGEPVQAMAKILKDEEQAKKVAKKCGADKGDPGETAFNVVKCFREETDELL